MRGLLGEPDGRKISSLRSTQLQLSSAAELTRILLAANRSDHARLLSRAVRIIQTHGERFALEGQQEILWHGFLWAKSEFAESLRVFPTGKELESSHFGKIIPLSSGDGRFSSGSMQLGESLVSSGAAA
jgi:hypothetical protein